MTEHALTDHDDGHSHDHHDSDHRHDSDHDHHHDHDYGEDPGIAEVIRLTTVGIDIGSATSQIGVSRVELTQIDGRYIVTSREGKAAPALTLTPYSGDETIDATGLRRFFQRQYADAAINPAEVESGAVILTGLALAKQNSRAIAELFADYSGRIVAVAAGDQLEARLACRGAGADQYSAETGASVLHLDVGGGTVKYSYVSHGTIAAVAAIDVGARLVRLDANGAIAGLEPPAADYFRDRGWDARPGIVPAGAWLDELAEHQAAQVLAHAGLGPVTPDRGLLRTPPLFAGDPPRIDALMVSGGVAEYVYGRESRDFGDLGLRLGRALRALLSGLPLELVEGRAGIHATVLGAAQFSVQLSGNTIYVSHPGALPARDVPVVRPVINLAESYVDESGVRDAVIRALSADDGHRRGPAAVALDWSGPVTARRVSAVARGIVAAHEADQRAAARDRGNPIVLVLGRDLARTVGHGVATVAGPRAAVVAVDGVRVDEFDFIDLGEVQPDSGAVPLVVKSLLFPR
jgi:ethanolamine utilization protein EutA